MKTLTLANQKGGVGKTAVATLLAQFLAREGKRVLAIDLDHQANFTTPVKGSGKAVVSEVPASLTFTTPDATVPAGNFVLVPSDPDSLMRLESQGQAAHNGFATNFRSFIQRQDANFDVCIIDTNPNPDIRLIASLIASDYLLSPIQLNQEAVSGIGGLINHSRVGYQKIKDRLNPKLDLIGLLPTLVEGTPFQRKNLHDIAEKYARLLIRLHPDKPGFAFLPKRSVIAEAQATGSVLWEMKKSGAREVWRELEPSFRAVATRMKVLEEGA